MVLFAFEVDTLEIALMQQQDLVDKIFIVESSASHKGVRQQGVCEEAALVTVFTGTQATGVGKSQVQPKVFFCEHKQSNPCCG